MYVIVARSASYVRGCRQTDVSVRPLSVCTDNNWFLPLVYESRTHASAYWDFENTIFTEPSKSLRIACSGTRFWRSFLLNWWKNKISQIRPGTDLRGHAWRSDVGRSLETRWWAVTDSCGQLPSVLNFLTHTFLKWQCRRFAHPCPAGICLVYLIMEKVNHDVKLLSPVIA